MNKTFEAKVAELVAVTRHLDVASILSLRRLTLADPQSLKWASEKQLNVVFDVILAKVLECQDKLALFEARQQLYAPLLPAGFEGLDENRSVLSRIVDPLLNGYEPPPEEEEVVGLDAIDTSSIDDFPTLFDDTICAYAKGALKPLASKGKRNDILVPFVLAPKFLSCYETVLREFVLPTMRASKKIKALGRKHDWHKEGPGKIIAIIQGTDDANNPILHQWDQRWNSFVRERAGSKTKELKPEDNPWPVFQEHAEKHGYTPPTEADIPLLRNVIRWEADETTEAWREIEQRYEQEYNPPHKRDQARPGTFRDGIIKWIERLPHNVGDLLAIRTHFDYPKKVDRLFLRTLIQTMGGTEKERWRKGPVLMTFYNDLPK
ncbi:MAG: hypothetical protein AB1918_10375 [Pseudomonadota bacterium]